MPTVGDSTDPQGTLQPKENPLVDEHHTFNHLNIPNGAPQDDLHGVKEKSAGTAREKAHCFGKLSRNQDTGNRPLRRVTRFD